MAYLPRNDAVRAERARREVMRRVTSARPRRAHVKTLTFREPGEITLATFFEPAEIAINPRGDDNRQEYKRIVAVNGWGSSGEVLISWQYNTGYFFENHMVSGNVGNRVVFDGLGGRPEPFIIEESELYGGEWIRPEVQEEPVFPASNFSFSFTVETIPR